MSHARGTTALVLAGGQGSRLRACIRDRPKALAPVAGRPFLGWLLDQLAGAGVARAVLCTGFLGEQIEHEYGSGHLDLELCFSREPRPLGTGGALRAALPFVQGDPVLVLNGDSYCDVPLARFAHWAGPRAALVAAPVPDAARFGEVHIDHDARVLAFAEKRAAGPGLVNAGIYCLPRRVLQDLPARTPLSLEHEVLPELLARGLWAWCTSAPLLDIGTPESYAAAQPFFARRAARASRGLLVLDRDGTLIAERGYLADPAGVELLPGAAEGLRRFAARGWAISIVTNQSGIGRGYFDERALAAVHRELLAQLAREGIAVQGIWHCPHRPEDGCSCRKPAPGLLQRALHELGFSPAQCLVVGDKACDIELGRRAGARTALVRTGYGAATEREAGCAPDLVVDALDALALQEAGA